jgi:hypothetical protein
MNLPPLPDYAIEFRPRWPGDPGGFTSCQMRSYGAAALEEAAKHFDVPDQIHGEIEDWNRETAAVIRALKEKNT